ncbi:sulfatase-like hydrolase/transferase [Methanosarcina sp. 1.H.A.2.2]|uniref:sulfatase-like hydrolase/transferase n=1 Tax=Methanosarcina sp. 1.H.A.2.2 TaxID=1483601 RepID=UPI000621408B|nr:sulfatase-like hydrolase/transferase [Methanosarcina sp. 1.H.A.2.2]KKH50731.1 hypothetical protein EO93_12555 [Methanosarcina sp. 1.H.A.2.2]
MQVLKEWGVIIPELIEYEPGTHFPGVIGGTLDESSPAWPKPTRTGKGAPNVIFFILDDVGYGQMSVFGGLCETPNLEWLANRGLRYINSELVASRDLPYTVPNLFGIIGLSCGYDSVDSVNLEEYRAPFTFTGRLNLTFQVN